jgi:autotransporter-associated beta strand protein
VWELAVAGVAGLLYTNGTANTVTWTVSDSNGHFDGRTYDAALVTVYTSSTLNQTLDYDLAEANAYMQNSGDAGAPSSRTLTITGVNTANVTGATYYAGYILGQTGAGGYNSLSFNGTALGNPPNNVAQGSNENYGPSVVPCNVASALSGTNTMQYSVAMSGGATNLVATVGLLAVTHPISVDGVWSGTAGGSWNAAGNWANSIIPSNEGDTAAFGTTIGSSAVTVTLDGSRCLSDLAFATTGGGSYTLSRTSGDTTSVLTLAATSGAAVSIGVSGGCHAIAVPVILARNLAVDVNAGSGLTVTGPISQTGTGQGVALAGGGFLVLSGSNTYTGGTTLSSGTIEFVGPQALPATGVLTVACAGTGDLTSLLSASLAASAADRSADPAATDGLSKDASAVPSDSAHREAGGAGSVAGGPAAAAPDASGSIQPVPEPAPTTLLLAGVAGAAAAFVRARSRQSVRPSIFSLDRRS